MNLDELQAARDRERRTDKLQELRDSFYADADEFVRQLRRERERAAERADDPFDAPEVNRLTDEIDTAEGTVEAVFERRIGKIVKAASLAAADQPIDTDGMTAEERALFEDLVGSIETTRRRILDGIGDGVEGAGSADAGAGDPTDTADARAAEAAGESAGAGPDGDVSAADLMGGGTGTDPGRSTATDSDPGTDRPAGEARAEAAAAGAADPRGGRPADADDNDAEDGPEGADAEERPVGDGGTVERETVRITADVGSILGVDQREYDLAAEDVVRLPAENAAPLVERDAAERLD